MILDFTNEKIVDDCNLRNFQVEWSVIVSQRRRRKAGWRLQGHQGKISSKKKKRVYRKGYYAAETHPGIYVHTFQRTGPLVLPPEMSRVPRSQ